MRRGTPRTGQLPACCAVPPRFSPMLASSGRPSGSLDRWAAEMKVDGWRAIVTVTGGSVQVRTRRGKDVTEAVPELAANSLPDVVLDGELVVGAGRLSDFYGLAGRLSGRPRNGSAPPVTFVAFDVLWIDGRPLIDDRYESRRHALEGLVLTGQYAVVPRFDATELNELLTACEQQDLEGVVLKRLGSKYRPGERSRDWLKVKCPGWRAHLERRVSAS
jgi:bifunctional non-homologous end joining protein LigD